MAGWNSHVKFPSVFVFSEHARFVFNPDNVLNAAGNWLLAASCKMLVASR